jgi:translation initiation factor 4G
MVASEEKSWDNIRESKEAHASSGKQDQLSSQFAPRAQVSLGPRYLEDT